MSEIAFWQKCVRQGQRIAGLLGRPMTLGVRAIALDDAGRVFLVRHGYVPGFHLPGGGVESGETAIESLLRELSEEGGLEAAETPRLLGLYYNPRHSRRDHVALYLVRDVRQDKPRAPDWEIVESGFFPLDALPEGATPSTRARIGEYLRRTEPALVW
ncbi:NUDIX domain-containing protein [Rhodoblastus acidophilus]|uniref:NUDIX domain-containing protein n=1 Tax=Candidatus Rhodoblastus alkanivorans TaxID=2954117 RepID=A0ABS9Z452_9HYPH|nr:NUDIX domain-containing protein [Candidatus Rhodoblastus alkanivorans]MCI4679262.1 NUDIX domain-containing protein [Candidatus Rhodoblastus alkanivorans]MCI4682414.1 NUDIX domain-containing protein [Candidatus Rhodoblastus alkanivorans]MDI4639719.1 NUDIX domain-containing protein [Rhodoblastus acidophilus]